MAHLQLRVYINPGEAEIFLKIRKPNGDDETLTAIVDTGAQRALVPNSLLEDIAYRQLGDEPFTITQAGIANQHFEAIEAEIMVHLEDTLGNISPVFPITAWFANTDTAIIGFGGILERAIFHLDMPNLSGYLEFPDPSPA